MYIITAYNGTTLSIQADDIFIAIQRFIYMSDLSVHDIKSVVNNH